MRLVTYTFRGTTRSGALVDDTTVVDLARGFAERARGDAEASASGLRELPSTMLGLLGLGDAGLDAGRAVVSWAQSRTGDAALRETGVLFGTDERGFRLEAP